MVPAPPTNPFNAKPTKTTGQVLTVLEQIRPAVQDDGGDVELVEITPAGVARVRFHGACVGCPSSELTLRHAIEKNIVSRVPEVKRVEAVE